MSYHGERILTNVLRALSDEPIDSEFNWHTRHEQRIVSIVTPGGPLAVVKPIAEKLLAEGVISGSLDGGLHAADAATVKAAILAAAVCDFCSARGEMHAFDVPDFEMPGGIGRSTGGWAACDACAKLVRAGRRKDLLERSIGGLAFPKFSRQAIAELHEKFWKGYVDSVTAIDMAKSVKHFLDDTFPAGPDGSRYEATVKEPSRIVAVQRLIGLTDREVGQIRAGGRLSAEIGTKLLAWKQKFGSDFGGEGMLRRLLENPSPAPLPHALPHWQVALDRKFEAMTNLEKALNNVEAMNQYFPDAIDLKDPAVIRSAVRRAEKIREFQHMGYAEDVAHLRTAEVYSFNSDTMDAIRRGAESIPHESPLNSVSLPTTSSGWFWFANPFPVKSSPLVSETTAALLWGWEQGRNGSKVPVLRFSAYVIENGRPTPSTKWTWPLDMTFHDMIALSSASHESLYGVGAAYEHIPNLVGKDVTLKCVADLSLFFLMACVWFKQKVVIAAPAHVERHARKRYQREHKLAEPPTVRVVALRASMHESDTGKTTEPQGEGHERTWHYRWVVDGHNRLQPCGPGNKDRKLIWISPFVKGPDDKPMKAKSKKVFAVIR